MATSSAPDMHLRADARKLRKKLRQIEGLEVLDRQLSIEEKEKVERKVFIRAELKLVLSQLSQESGSSCAIKAPDCDKRVNAETPRNATWEESTSDVKIKTEPSETDQEPLPAVFESEVSSAASNLLQTEEPVLAKKPKEEVFVVPAPIVAGRSSSRSVVKADPTPSSHPEEATTAMSKLWKSSKCSLAVLSGHSDMVCAVSCCGRFMASGSRDTTAKLWNLDKLEEVTNFGGHTGSVTAVLLLDGTSAVSAINGTEEGQIQQDDAPVMAVISGSTDCSVKVWRCDTGSNVRSVYMYNPVTCLAYMETGNSLAVGMAGGKVDVLDLHTLERVASATCDQEDVACISVDGRLLCAGTSSGLIRVYTAAPALAAHGNNGHHGGSSGSAPLLLDCLFSTERAWASSGHSPRRTIDSIAGLRSLLLRGDLVLVGNQGSSIKLIDWKSGRVTRLSNHCGEFGVTDDLVVCHQGTCLLSTAYDYDAGTGFINVRNLSADGQYLGSLECCGDLGRLLCMTASPNGDCGLITVATGGYELCVWQVQLSSRVAGRAHSSFTSQATAPVTRAVHFGFRPEMARAAAVESDVESDGEMTSEEDDDNSQHLQGDGDDPVSNSGEAKTQGVMSRCCVA